MITLKLEDGTEERLDEESWLIVVQALTRKSLTGSASFLDDAKLVVESGRVVRFRDVVAVVV